MLAAIEDVGISVFEEMNRVGMMYVEVVRLINCNEFSEFFSHRSRANDCYHQCIVYQTLHVHPSHANLREFKYYLL